MKNKIMTILCEMGISDEESIVPYYPKVRDRGDVSILRCKRSGVILLSKSDHIDISHYKNKEYFRYCGEQDRKTAILTGLEDAKRRFYQLRNIVCKKKWMDIGSGAGGILDLLSPVALETLAVEVQETARKRLIDLGYKVYSSIDDVLYNDIDIVTLFHVFEHLIDPIETLKTIREKMAKGAKIIIEVPHAKDFLISFLEIEAFKAFTFWSEHLILHTRESLKLFLEKAGFSSIVIKSFQRYPLANHLYWIAKGKPGGHLLWDCLRTADLDNAYANMLSSIDNTDTLIAIGQN